MNPAPAGLALPDSLRMLEGRLAQLDRAMLREALAPVLDGLRAPQGPDEARAAASAALAICRRLYANARSTEALALARAVLAQSRPLNDAALTRRATTACGLLLADSGDVVDAIAHHVESLRLADAQNDCVEASRVWTNIGATFCLGGNFELAVHCYRRAMARIEQVHEPLFSRFAACSNLANNCYQLGRIEEGLAFANGAMLELTPAIRDEDPHAVLLLRRNLARLLIAAGSLPEAQVHVEEAARLAEEIRTPRALIAAATARAALELATGRGDVALTRLDQALARAREVPTVLRDTLACVIRAEEATGNPQRALVRLRELSDHVYRTAIDRAREHVELSRFEAMAYGGADAAQEQLRARLIESLDPPSEPPEWRTLQRLAMGSALRFDPTGEHGLRVGAVTKALALAWGCPPLDALEIGLAAELHDIGMASVPEGLFAKRDPLNEVERNLVQRHTDAGAEILRDDHHPRMLVAREIAKYHHARWDGSGYPERVGGRFIPLPARLCAVADAYDSLICGEAGRAGCSMDEALAALGRAAGTQFDPDIVRCFDAMIRNESSSRGIDPASVSGAETFRELVASLQEDRGFM